MPIVYHKTLDLPKIPEHLYEKVEDILAKPNQKSSGAGWNYILKEISLELRNWLTENMPFELRAMKYCIIRSGIPHHKDFRTLAINYVIKAGGPAVKTSFFCLLYTSPSPRDRQKSRMPSSA